MKKKLGYLLIALVLSGLFALGGCKTQTTLPTGNGATWHLVVIGDSSMWELADAYAAQIENDMGVTVIAEDFALGTLSAVSVLEALETGKSTRARLEALSTALEEADVVVMFVNPMESDVPGKAIEMEGCFMMSKPGNCDSDRFSQYVANLDAIWKKVIELRAGQPTILRATDLYNPLLSEWTEAEIFPACDVCWMNLSAASKMAAEDNGIPFLSRYDAFNGKDHLDDPRARNFIVSDGEHPTLEAAQYTAQLLAEMGYQATIP